MTREQQIAVLRRYDEHFSKWEPCRSEADRALPVGMGRGIKHARWMVQEMLRRLENDEESSPGQADRWIGFVQAVLWTHGIFSISEMAEHNTAKPVDSEKVTT